MRDDGEPVGRGRLDRRAAEAQSLKDALFAIALFTGVVIVNGIVAIALIEFFQVVGWWAPAVAESGQETTRVAAPRH